MYVHARFIISALFVLLASCSTVESTDQLPDETSCAIGETCTIIGELHVYRGSPASVAEIITSQGCFAAALEDSLYRSAHLWTGRTVRASGTLYSQVNNIGIISYELNGRSVATGICSSRPIMFVDDIRLD